MISRVHIPSLLIFVYCLRGHVIVDMDFLCVTVFGNLLKITVESNITNISLLHLFLREIAVLETLKSI